MLRIAYFFTTTKKEVPKGTSFLVVEVTGLEPFRKTIKTTIYSIYINN